MWSVLSIHPRLSFPPKLHYSNRATNNIMLSYRSHCRLMTKFRLKSVVHLVPSHQILCLLTYLQSQLPVPAFFLSCLALCLGTGLRTSCSVFFNKVSPPATPMYLVHARKSDSSKAQTQSYCAPAFNTFFDLRFKSISGKCHRLLLTVCKVSRS